MATIREDYVSSETAKLLKEKGFPQDPNMCNTAYTFRGKLSNNAKSFVHNFTEFDKLGIKPITYSMAPTLQMAMKWLREVHKISIEITSTGYLIDNDVEWECDIKAGHRLYFRHITNEKSFESCAEAAIKYCLEKLI